MKDNLRVFIDARASAERRSTTCSSTARPASGKTTLAHIIANELEVPIKTTSGPAFQNAAELLGVLSHIETNQVVFIDEIHRLPRILEEHLYQAMDALKCELIVDKGPNARHYTLNIEPFTLIGATTRAGMITAPLRDRFGVVMRLDFYTPAELCTIIKRSAGISGNRNLRRRCRRDRAPLARYTAHRQPLAQAHARLCTSAGEDVDRPRGGRLCTGAPARRPRGLDEMDRRILMSIVQKFGGGPVGIQSLAVAVSEEQETLEDVYEPFLIQQGFLQRTPRGRVATPLALTHLGLTATPGSADAETRLL